MTELKIGERDAEVDCDRSQTRVCMELVRVKKTGCGVRNFKGVTYTTPEEMIGYRNLEKIHVLP